MTKAFAVGMGMTLFPFFDIPVFWPILLLYWLVLLYAHCQLRLAQPLPARGLRLASPPLCWRARGEG
eukprot:scaffold1837_cov391-Prasinococcus_capsulatus_cf.AAC.5